jgi:hypothetical protein
MDGLRVFAAKLPGSRQYRLLGARFFSLGSRITGTGESRINVTSVKAIPSACAK